MDKSIKNNAFYNVIKQCCNIIFPLITYPYVSRVLLSDNLGKYSFSDSVITLAMTIAALGINTYGIREGARIRNDKVAITRFSAQIFTINSLSTLIVYIILGTLLLFFPRFQKDSIITVILSFNIICNTLSRDWINQIFEDYKYITIRYIAFQVIALLMTFVFVHRPDDCIKYALIMLLANSGGYLTSIFYTQKYVPLRLTRHLNCKKHIKPIMYLLGVALAIQVYVKSDIMVLGFFRSDSEVGIYTVASKVYIIIKALPNAVISVTIPRLANYYGNNDIQAYKELLEKLRGWIVVLIFPCVAGLFCLSEEMLSIIGGKDYIQGDLPLKILSITLAFAVLGCYYANCFLVVRRKDSVFFKATVVSALVNVILNIILIPYAGMCGAAITTLIAEIIVLSICLFYSRDIKNKFKKEIIIPVVLGCIGVFIVCYITKYLIEDVFLKVGVAYVVSAVVYYILNKIMKNPVIFDIESSAILYLKSLNNRC